MSILKSPTVLKVKEARAYRLLLLAVGIGLLIWVTFQTAANIPGLWPGLIVLFFVAIMSLFPLTVFRTEVFLFHVVTLGGSLLFGPTIIGWAAVLGVLLGLSTRRAAQILFPTPFLPPSLGFWEASFITGRHTLALLLPLIVVKAAAVSLSPRYLLSVPVILAVLLMYAILQLGFILLDFFLRRPDEYPKWSQDFITLTLIEFIPLPFVAVFVRNTPFMSAVNLTVLGSIPTISAILLYRISFAHRQLERRVEELSALNQISQVVRSTLDLDVLLREIQVQLDRILGIDNFYVGLVNPDRDEIWYPIAVKQGEREYWPARPLQNRLTDQVIRSGRPVLLNAPELKNLPEAELPPSEGTPKSWAGVPLIASEGVIGCLVLLSYEADVQYNQEDLDLLVILSGQISVSIENALLYQQSQERADQLEALNKISSLISASLDPERVIEQACQSALQLANSDRCAIYTLNIQENQIHLASASHLSEVFIQHNRSFSIADNERTRCLRTGRPVLVANVQQDPGKSEYLKLLEQEGILAFGEFPLTASKGQVGFIAVYFDAPHTFSPQEVDLLQTLAAQAALAVSNARLYASTDFALSQRANQLSILEAIGRELSAAIHSDRLFEIIVSYALEFSQSSWGRLGLYNPAFRAIEVKAQKGYPTPLGRIPINEGICTLAILNQEVVIRGNVREEPTHIDFTGGVVRSHLSAPLIHEEQVLGVLTVESPEIDAYAENEASFISQLANQAAVAVVNASLYEEVQERLYEQSLLYQVSSRLASNLELRMVLETVRNAFLEAQRSAVVGIYLWNGEDRAYILQTDRAQASLPEEERVEPAAANHLPEAIPEDTLAALGSALMKPDPLHFHRSRIFPDSIARGCTACQLIVLPLVVHQQRVGLVSLHLPIDETLNGSDLNLLRSIAIQSAISLANALLFLDVIRGRDQLTTVLNTVQEGILLVDDDGRIILVNQAAYTLTGVAPSDVQNKLVAELDEKVITVFGYTRQKIQELLEVVRQGQIPHEPLAILNISQVKPERILERTLLPVWGRGGDLIGWMIVLRDVTEEHQIALAREVITETLVHDLRSPLTVVTGSLEVLESEMDVAERISAQAAQALQIAQRSARRIQNMVETLLDISRLQSGQIELHLEEIDLVSFLPVHLTDFKPRAEKVGISLHSNILPDLPRVYADPEKLARVVTNLLDNALKFTPPKGEVLLSTERYTDKMVAVIIADTGPGVPEEFREKIFERFAQVPGLKGRQRGTGLGLTFCRLAVEAHKGRIWVETGPKGIGSAFKFTLPVTPPPSQSTKPGEAG